MNQTPNGIAALPLRTATTKAASAPKPPTRKEVVEREVRVMFARMLASENIRVTHSPKITTGAFDTTKRELFLPMWEGVGQDEYIALVAHEVGHALWSPRNWMQRLKEILVRHGESAEEEAMPFHWLKYCWNAVEDARIDRRMMGRYQGLKRCYFLYRGGTYLSISTEREKEAIATRNPPRLSTSERLLKHFKVGVFLTEPVEFNEIEMGFARRMSVVSSDEEVMRLAEDIWFYEKQTNQDPPPPQPKEGEEEEEREEEATGGGVGGTGRYDPDAAYQSHIPKGTTVPFYRDIPDYKGIIPPERWKPLLSNMVVESCEPLYADFITKNNPSIQILWTEFHRRAAASTLARERSSDTGTVDPTKLWSYRTSEDIFLTHTEVFRGVDHGIVLYLDWSGSMQSCLRNIAVECMCLVEFARRSQIPAVVYAFTDAFGGNPSPWDRRTTDDISTPLSLLQLIDTRLPEREYREMASLMLGITRRISSGGNGIPTGLKLGGTPLNASICTAMSLVPKFRKETGAKIVHSMFLTDGDATDRFVSNADMGNSYPELRLRREGFTQTVPCGGGNATATALTLLKDICPESRFINIHIETIPDRKDHKVIPNYGGFDARILIDPTASRSVRLLSAIAGFIADKDTKINPWG